MLDRCLVFLLLVPVAWGTAGLVLLPPTGGTGILAAELLGVLLWRDAYSALALYGCGSAGGYLAYRRARRVGGSAPRWSRALLCVAGALAAGLVGMAATMHARVEFALGHVGVRGLLGAAAVGAALAALLCGADWLVAARSPTPAKGPHSDLA